MINSFKFYLISKGIGPTQVAKRVGVTPSAVSAWLAGRSKPRLKVAKKVKKYCDVPLSIWGYAEES